MITSVGMVNAKNQLVYCYGEDNKDLMYLGLDFVKNESGDCYLGYLTSMEEKRLYGWKSNSKWLILVVSTEEQDEVQEMCRLVYGYYLEYVSNPFTDIVHFKLDEEFMNDKVKQLI